MTKLQSKSIEQIAELESKLLNYNEPGKVISSQEYQKILDSKPKMQIIRTISFAKLDELTDGFRPGEVIVVTGYTGKGKTTFCKTLTNEFYENNINCLWFCYEGNMSDFFCSFVKLPVFYLPENLVSNSWDWIEDRIIEAKLKYNTQVVFLDHLHFVVDFSELAKGSSLYLGVVMRHIKMLAVKHNIAFFLIAHTMKMEEDKEPTLNDLRDSSFIAQESDIVLAIWRKAIINQKTKEVKYTGETFLRVLKNRRNGKYDKISLRYESGALYEEH